jgi:Ser/Thr protein kinase RdoA (MazF antagonist)
VIQNSNKLGLRLLPCDVFARVAVIGEEVAALEVELAQQLVAAAAPVVALEARLEPRVYERDGFAVTFWTFYDANSGDRCSSADYAHVLQRLHVGLRNIDVPARRFTDRIDEALRLVEDHDRTPALDSAGRELLLDTLNSACGKIDHFGAVEQLLHGEPHSGNVLNTTDGLLFVDLETCCRGPVEFDAAHLPSEVTDHYLELDQDLFNECRRLVLAMVAAWRCDVHDQFPDGLRHGRTILELLRAGPPWSTLGSLVSE